MIYLCIYSPVCSVWLRLVYSLLPVFPVCKPCLVLPCLALMSSLKTIIWVYVLVCVFLYPPCCVHQLPAVAIPSPPAGSLVPGVPLPQARRPAADSMPAGPPLNQARRIAADSCPPVAANPSPVDPVHMSRPGEPCLCLVVPTGTF